VFEVFISHFSFAFAIRFLIRFVFLLQSRHQALPDVEVVMEVVQH